MNEDIEPVTDEERSLLRRAIEAMSKPLVEHDTVEEAASVPTLTRAEKRASIKMTWPRSARLHLAGFGAWRRHKYLNRQ